MRTAGRLRFLSSHRGILLLALLCMAFNAFATGFYAYLLGPVVKFLFSGGLLEGDSLTRLLRLVGLEPRLGDRNYVLALLPVLVLIAAAVKGVSQYGKFYLMGRWGELTVFRLRSELLSALHHLPGDVRESKDSGDLLTRAISDVGLLQEALTNAVGSLVSDSLKVLVLLSVAVYLDWRLAAVTLAALPFIALPIVLVGRWLKKTAVHRQQAVAGLTSHVREDLEAAELIRNYGLQKERLLRYRTFSRAYLDASLKSYGARAAASPIMEVLGALGLGATLWLAGTRMQAGELVPEHFISFFAAILLLYEPLKNLGRLNNVIQSGRAGMMRALEMLDWPDERERDRGEASIHTFERAITFADVHFSYGDRPVFTKLNLTLRKGERLAVVGASGVGKTSLVRLLCRRMEPSGGEITIDGVPLEEIRLGSLRKAVCVVEQRPILFSDSIRNNILFARPEATSDDLERATRSAGLEDFLKRLPRGLDTPVGEGGAALSEGEKQRISLARAFLRQSPVIVLDEVTSALDAVNEAAIREALQKLGRERTLLIIAHRLSTIREADRIVVLEEGRVVQEGRHEDLADREGPYRAFLCAQETR